MIFMLPEISEVKKRRKNLGLSQKQLANAVGVSQSAIAKLESGKINPSYELMRSILDFLSSSERRSEATAKDLMNPKVITCSSKESVFNAVKLMQLNGISQLPIVEGDKIVGGLSEKSILRKIASVGDRLDAASVSVEEFMDEPFPQIPENAPLSSFSSLLQYSQAVLVMRKEKIVGIITRFDLLKTLTK